MKHGHLNYETELWRRTKTFNEKKEVERLKRSFGAFWEKVQQEVWNSLKILYNFKLSALWWSSLTSWMFLKARKLKFIENLVQFQVQHAVVSILTVKRRNNWNLIKSSKPFHQFLFCFLGWTTSTSSTFFSKSNQLWRLSSLHLCSVSLLKT